MASGPLSPPPPGPGKRLKRPGLIGLNNNLSQERVEFLGEYTSLLPACFLKKDISVPEIIDWNPKDSTYTAEIMELEMEWLNQVAENIGHNDSLLLSWSVYNAKYVTNINIKSISSMLPLFKEDLHSVSLMTHVTQLNEKVTNFLNPGQTLVSYLTSHCMQ